MVIEQVKFDIDTTHAPADDWIEEKKREGRGVRRRLL